MLTAGKKGKYHGQRCGRYAVNVEKKDEKTALNSRLTYAMAGLA